MFRRLLLRRTVQATKDHHPPSPAERNAPHYNQGSIRSFRESDVESQHYSDDRLCVEDITEDLIEAEQLAEQQKETTDASRRDSARRRSTGGGIDAG